MSDNIISIDELENTLSKTLNFHFEDTIEEINCVEPIVSDLTIISLGEFVEIKGNVKGIVKLECDVCLKEFEYNLDFEIDEMLEGYDDTKERFMEEIEYALEEIGF